MFKNILQLRLFTVLIVIVGGFFLISIIRIAPSIVSVNKEVGNLDNKIAEVKKNNDALEKQREYFKSDAYLERQARIKLNFKRPDENVVFVYKNPYNQTSSGSTTKPELKNWQKWLIYLWHK